ncbi:NAD(P)-binding domain-containing protein [Rhodothermus marinus]|nr:NAD(P)-binding domain-containing protein [Rhodothermus marinus]
MSAVAVIGLGRMGQPIARNLLKAATRLSFTTARPKKPKRW